MFGKKDKVPDQFVYCIFDSKAEFYELPVYAVNDQDMSRQVLNLFQDPQQARNRLILNAEDFSVFCIGTFERRTGQIEPCAPRHVLSLHEVRAAAEAASARMKSVSGPGPVGIVPT